MADNRISLTIDNEKLVRINDALTVLETELGSILYTLTSDEKKRILRLGDKSIAFVNKAYEVAKLDPEVVSLIVDIPEFGVDIDAIATLKPISYRLEKLASNLTDAEALSGHEAYQAALQTYALFKNAAKMGHPGAKAMVEQLKERFPRTTRKKETEEVNN